MNIDTTCPGCGRKLRVASDQAGKPARCPLCNTIYTVAEAGTRASTAGIAERWHLKTPEGQAYGPVTRDVLDQWVAEGRISDDCRIMCEVDGVWQDASNVYPVLRPLPKGIGPQPVFDNPVIGTPQASPSVPAEGGKIRIVNPHRGGLVLALGILSWAIGCPIFGIMAWVMGSSDLRDMQRGAMDARGMGLTQAGQIIGMIHAILMLAALVFVVFAMLAWGLWR